MKTLITLLLLTFTLTANAAKEPRDGRLDSRIKTFQYSEGEVYKLHTHYLQDTLVMFSDDEKIIHIGAGDPLAWTIVPVNNYISIKPVEEKADTNLNILTESLSTGAVKSYIFELNAGNTRSIKDPSASFLVKFRYPQIEMAERLRAMARKEAQLDTEVVAGRKRSAEDWNLEYTYAGNTSLIPVRVFDDGEFTYFKFPENIDTPAIFLVDENKKESLVNYHVTDKYLVVQRVGKQFILRDGDRATCIFNKGFVVGGETVLKHEALANDNTDSED